MILSQPGIMDYGSLKCIHTRPRAQFRRLNSTHICSVIEKCAQHIPGTLHSIVSPSKDEAICCGMLFSFSLCMRVHVPVIRCNCQKGPTIYNHNWTFHYPWHSLLVISVHSKSGGVTVLCCAHSIFPARDFSPSLSSLRFRLRAGLKYGTDSRKLLE